jgi:hypothetical protein
LDIFLIVKQRWEELICFLFLDAYFDRVLLLGWDLVVLDLGYFFSLAHFIE